MYRPRGYLDDPTSITADDILDTVAMATKEILYHKNGGAPFITVSRVPEPEPRDVHFYHYYSNSPQNGSPRNHNPTPPTDNSPQSYVMVGTIEYGRLTSIDPTRSSPGVSGLPTRVLQEIQSVYSSVPSAVVIVTRNSGQYTIQTQITSPEVPPSYNQQPEMTPRYPQYPQQGAQYPQQGIQYPQPGYLPPPMQQPYNTQLPPGVQPPPRPPIIMYQAAPPAPVRPRIRRQEDKSIEITFDSDSDSDDAMSSISVKKNDSKSQLARKHKKIYKSEKDDSRSARSGRRSSPSGRRSSPSGRVSPKGVYRTGKRDDRRIRNSNQDPVLSDHSRR